MRDLNAVDLQLLDLVVRNKNDKVSLLCKFGYIIYQLLTFVRRSLKLSIDNKKSERFGCRKVRIVQPSELTK